MLSGIFAVFTNILQPILPPTEKGWLTGLPGVFLVPKLCLGADTVKLRFIQEAELQEYVLPSWSLGARKRGTRPEP